MILKYNLYIYSKLAISFLKEFGEPMRRRFREHEERPASFEEFGKSLQQISKALNLYHAQDEKYAHLEKNDIERVTKCLEDKQRWYDEKASLCAHLKPHEDPQVFCSQIKAEKDVSVVNIKQIVYS